MYDLVIRGGEVVDGTGAPARRADVAVDGGRIVAVGELTDGAARTIDAEGLVVAPGFVDVHTHLDVQGFWDPTLSPSPLHGVTTALAGNCGFTVAPLDDTSGDYLMRMLARVEGMPLAALEKGVPWDWRTTAEFLDRLDGTLAINTGYMVGHSALRRVAMGPAATERPATDDELATMRRLLHEGLAAGGLGFSTTRAQSHHDGEGRPVPSRWATDAELLELAAVAGEHPGTSLEYLPTVPGKGPFPDDIGELMIQMSLAAGRPLNWNILTVAARTLDDARAKLALGDQAKARGAKVVGLTMPDTPPSRFSFLSGFVLDMVPGLHDFLFLPPAERLAILRDPARRAALRDACAAPSPYSHLVDWRNRHIIETFSDATRGYAGRAVGEIAAEQGRDPFETFMDIVVADELRTTFSNPWRTPTAEDWAARAEIWRDPRAVVGASDAGAHLDMIGFFAYTTMLLHHGVREHKVISLEEAVRLLTSVPADLYGLRGRGRLAVGSAADVVVFDPAAVTQRPLTTRFDLPAGAGRLYSEPEGIAHVVVGGTPIVAGRTFTGQTPGRVLRSGRDTDTPAMV